MPRARRVLWVLVLIVLTSVVATGCMGGRRAPDFTRMMRGSEGSERQPPPDDRTVFRSIPARGDAPVETLASSALHELYAEILSTYVDPVGPGVLIEGALKGIHIAAVEQGISPLDVDMLQLMPVRESRDPERDWAQFAAWYEAYLAKIANRVPPWPVGQAAAKGMLEALGDPNSTYMDRRTVESQQRGEAGIGVTLSTGAQQRGEPIVREVVPGSHAEAAGIRLGDTIVAVEGTSTSSMTLNESTQAIRGPDGTRVRLTVRSFGDPATRDATITRAPLNTPAVVVEAHDGVEYVKVRRLQEGVARSIQEALVDSLRRDTQGWILDLRSTSSGSIEEVIDLASLFVGPQVIGAVVDRSQRPSAIRSLAPALEPRLPTVVLIDADTGSGGEILAAAMKEYHVATLVGGQTAGRAALSEIVPLPDGSVAQITSQRILTASGSRLEGVGVAPHYAVESSVEDWVLGRDPQLSQALALLRNANWD